MSMFALTYPKLTKNCVRVGLGWKFPKRLLCALFKILKIIFLEILKNCLKLRTLKNKIR